MTQKRIAVMIGSLRKDSINRKMANNFIKLAPQTLKLEILEIADLQMYNQDLDEQPPQSWVNFRKRLKDYEGVLFVTPEYNRSVPAVLKNAIDVGSRPYGQSAWDKKPTAVVSVSPSALGGFGANHHLRQSLVFLNMPVMQQPEAYIGNAAFDSDGNISSESTQKFATKIMEAFSEWILNFNEPQKVL